MKINVNSVSRIRWILLAFLPLFCGNLLAREVITLQTGWKFQKGPSDEAALPEMDDSGWRSVTVPHDWGIEGPVQVDGDGNTGKLPWKGEGWYRNKMMIPSSYQGKTVYIVCDGVMAFPEIFVNGKAAGKWDYGYSSFYFDITSLIQPGRENLIAVHADTRQHDSRWYPGAGIYRKVQLVVVDPIHVGIWGTYVYTPIVKSNYADVRVRTTLMNRSDYLGETLRVEYAILNPEGAEVGRKTVRTTLDAGKSKNVEADITLINPQRWELENPVLYQVKTSVYQGETLVDTQMESFGVRTIRFTADHGFYLNDRRVQLQGVCLHHDHGPLGAAFYPRAMERQLEIMKSMGCNAIRTSHNVPAPELLDLCDRMGILVIDEAFDKYDRKADMTPDTDFDAFAQRNMHNMVVRDRNHPSIILWSIGNEMTDLENNRNLGFEKMQIMINYVRKYDPERPVTMVSCDANSPVTRHFDYYDVHGWNYDRRWDLARRLEPNKSVIITESGSTVSTRGFYELPLPALKTDFTNALQVSSYDLNAPAWAEIPDDDFMWQQQEEYIAGEFVWTGIDYLGEPTPYGRDWIRRNNMTGSTASRSSYFGIVDLCGIPKDRYYLYRSYWNTEENTLHILPHWNWEEGQHDTIPVFVYTNGDAAELFLNGKSLGMQYKKPTSQKSTERFRLMWMDVPYQPGELKAVAYKEGVKIAESVMKTAGDPYEIRLTPDRTSLQSGGMDLSYVLVEAFDKEGNPCPLANHQIQLQLKGKGKIAGVGNGDPQCMDEFQSDKVRLFYGKAMVILQSGFDTGDLELTASSEGLVKQSVVVNIQ